MVSYMQRVFAALLMLGLYHVLLQQFASVDTAPAASIRPCRNGKAAAATADGITSMTTAHAARRPGRAWRPPVWSNIEANEQASMIFGDADPAKTTLHFTFGSASMMQFFRNWLHFVRKVGIGPVVIGAADKQMYVACTAEEIAAIAIAPGLDVWTYTRRGNVSTVVQEGHSEWKYYRHHKSSFLEIGLVKAAFLWELLALGFDVLISDLDIVWLSPRWEPWMTYRHEATYPPYREAALMAMADVLVSTDELDEAYDGFGSWERWPFGVGWGRRSELNTGVLFFRATNGSRAFVQAWRLAMLAKRNVSACLRTRHAHHAHSTERGLPAPARSAGRIHKRPVHLLRNGPRGVHGAGHILSSTPPSLARLPRRSWAITRDRTLVHLAIDARRIHIWTIERECSAVPAGATLRSNSLHASHAAVARLHGRSHMVHAACVQL